MCEALRELMKEEIEEELKKSRDKAIQEGLAQGLAQGLEQGLEQGIEQGLEQGYDKHLYVQVQKKLEKGKSISQIADECEESEDAICKIISEKEIDRQKMFMTK